MPEKLIRQVINPDPRPLKDFEYAYSLLGKLEGKKLLDYGAGDGWNTICFAKAKAKVWAIDISEKGIELIKKKAKANDVSEFVTAEVRNCYKTQFPSNEFDIIYGGGVLHHLNIEIAGQEISRLLCPDGVAVFFEPIRESKVMDIIKVIVLRLLRRKPLEETENENPLTSSRIDQLKSYFKFVRYRQFNVLTSAGLLINSQILKWFLMWADYIFMKYIPGFKKLGRAVVIELREPIKKI
jgi:ubiquinone/menaquinone biosynthesis C-methylase UbiE